MASGNLIQGQGAGKLGDVVLMVRNGEQVARVYTKAGARSGSQASEASRIQRIKFGSASNQWSLYRYICTRMYRKGKASNLSDYNYFVKKNQPSFPYLTKSENADGVHMLQPGIFSEGNLGRIDVFHRYVSPSSSSPYHVTVRDLSAPDGTTVRWTATMAELKTTLQSIYPNARKVTYLFSVASDVEIEIEGETILTQSVTHSAVIIDLYSQSVSGEDTMTIAAFFSSKMSNPALSAMIEAQTRPFMQSGNIFQLWADGETINPILNSFGLLLFATDDNASDCYTTTLAEDSVNPTQGVYSIWASYRTPASLRIAADSYGYQGGVMRDDIASAGNEISTAVTRYAAKLRSIDPAAAEEYLTSIGDVKAVQAKVVRKPTTASEDK